MRRRAPKVTVSWSAITEPASSDWVGLYAQGGSSAIGGATDSLRGASSGAVPRHGVVHLSLLRGGRSRLDGCDCQRTIARRDVGTIGVRP